MGANFRRPITPRFSARGIACVAAFGLLACVGAALRSPAAIGGEEVAQRSPEARVVIDDGRRFLERTRARYDVITIDPPPPVEAAASGLLYSRDFYSVIKTRMAPGGILQQWLPSGERIVVSAVARALSDSFPSVRVFRSVEGWGFHFLASDRTIRSLPASALAARLPARAAADLLEWGPHDNPEAQFQAVVGSELSLADLIALDPEAPALQDDRPVNEYYFLRRTFARSQPPR